MPHIAIDRMTSTDYPIVASAMLAAGQSLADDVDRTLVIRAGATQVSRPIDLELSTPYEVKTNSARMIGIDLRVSDAAHAKRFPIVTGEIAALPAEEGTELSAGGWYRPPFGLLGAAADGLLLRGAGRKPVVMLLEQLLDAIEARIEHAVSEETA